VPVFATFGFGTKSGSGVYLASANPAFLAVCALFRINNLRAFNRSFSPGTAGLARGRGEPLSKTVLLAHWHNSLRLPHLMFSEILSGGYPSTILPFRQASHTHECITSGCAVSRQESMPSAEITSYKPTYRY
jgi:hypothetical protein